MALKPRPECIGTPNKSCWRRGTLERGGKLYCWQHDPIRVEAERAKKREKDRAERAEWAAKFEAQAELRDLRRDAGVSALTKEDLRTVIGLGGVQAMIQKLQGGQSSGTAS